MRRYDALYLPPQTTYRVETSEAVDLAEASAPCARQTPVQCVPFSAVECNPKLHFNTGSTACTRDVFLLAGHNLDASRLVCGITFGLPGNWTGWIPHEHAQSREEVYLYIEMPPPSFGIQMVYEHLRSVEFIQPVFGNDAVAITAGFHPNLGAPGFGINYLWIMAGLREDVDRGFGNLRLQPEFALR